MFVHLHCRSYFSLKDGAYSPEDLVIRAAELGMPAVALTDRDGLYGAPRFAAAAKQIGIKPILGARLTLAEQRLTLDHSDRRRGPALRRGRSGELARALSAGERRVAEPHESRSLRSLRSAGTPKTFPGPPATPLPPRFERPRSRSPALEEPRLRQDPAAHHVILLARDATGYGNLCRLITAAHMARERGEPSLLPAEVIAAADGLVCLLGSESPPGRRALSGRPGAARELARPWREAFGPWCFVEIRDLLEPGSTAEVRLLLRLAEEAGLPAVATNAVRYLVSGDAFLADALECMREIVPVSDGHVTRRNAEGWLKPPAQMRERFSERPDLCDNAVRIAEACTFDLGIGEVHFPDFPAQAGRSATSLLAERCHRGLAARGMRLTREVQDRLDLELDQIRRMGYAAYFLTVADIVREVKEMGIRCAARGSAAGSLVCYATEVSEVDPIHHGLLFERFINPLRDELPDIDFDVESAHREEVYDMVLRRYGEDRCACVTMVDTYRARAAVREVGKALGYPEAEVDVVAKAFPHIGAHRIREAMEALPELRDSNLAAGQLELLFRVAERLNGFPRHLALHPSGIVLSDHDLPDRVPMERSFLGHRMVQADKDDVELLGLLKLDVLGVRMLSAMHHCIDEVERTTGEAVDLDAVPRDDPETFELIRSSRTIGCFQIESPGQRELLQKFQPDRFEDLIIDISLFRPGPVKSDMVTPFIKRRHQLERPRYAHPLLRPILQETYGVIVYHEQVMQVLAASGCSFSEADRIRRHLDDEIEIDDHRVAFLSRATAKGLGTEDAQKVWQELASFASFGFCKAHAAAFAVPTYQSAWLKAHYPAHFLAGVLTHEPGMYPRRLILQDAREFGVPILLLDVNRSQKTYTVEPTDGEEPHGKAGRPRPKRGSSSAGERERGRSKRGGNGVAGGPGKVFGVPADRSERSERDSWGSATRRSPSESDRASSPERPRGGAGPPRPNVTYGIRLALQDVHGISDAEIVSILEARARRPFTGVGDFLRRTNVSRPVTEALAHAGAFDTLAAVGSRRQTRRDRLYVAMTAEPEREGEQLTLAFGGQEESPGLREYTGAEVVRAELEVTGLDASRHLLSFYEPLLTDLGVVRAPDLRRRRGDEMVMVAGVKVASQTPAVRSGQRIIFLTLDDATGPVDVTVFERVQDRVARTVFHGFLLAVWGRLRRTGVGGVSIIAEEVWDLVALAAARRGGRLLEVMAEAAGSPGHASTPRKMWHSSGGSTGW
ncbi:MAG: DNA polymerase III subunit alpha [Actinomycetota bacterium]